MTGPNPDFATTHWTLVWQAAKEDSQHGRPALTEIIRGYWGPLYGFARRRGLSPEDAEDATQEFLEGIVRGELLDSADPAKGKFRAFLLTAWRRFLVDQYRRKSAVRRGGQARVLSLDFGHGERRWLELESRSTDPDKLFNLSWAESLLDEARNRLRTEYTSRGQNRVYEALMPCITAVQTAEDYARLGEQLGCSPGALKVALHRLRQRFGQSLRDIVAETVDDPSEVDAEISELLSLMS